MTTPAPLTPPDCDLRGLEYMPLLGTRLFGSEFNALATDSEWRAAMTLWWAAWTQCPAASLPDDDIALCRLADLGRDVRGWKKLRVRALHGFVKCSDGRLYHPTLAAQALVAWDKRVKERERKAQWRAKKQGQEQGQDGDVPRDKTPPERGRDADVPADGTRRDGTGRDDSYSVPDGTAAPPPDPVKVMFDSGIALLGQAGVPTARARPLLGKWRQAHGEEAVISALGRAHCEGAIDPISFIEGVLRNGNHRGSGNGAGRPVDGFGLALRRAEHATSQADRWPTDDDGGMRCAGGVG